MTPTPHPGWASSAFVRQNHRGLLSWTETRPRGNQVLSSALSVASGEVFGFLGPNGAGKSTVSGCCSALPPPPRGGRKSVTPKHVRSASPTSCWHTCLLDVALWPRLTGAETLELLAHTGTCVDRVYRHELVERFALDLSRPSRTYSTGNRQKVALVAAFATRAP